jgi:hypothetical protein
MLAIGCGYPTATTSTGCARLLQPACGRLPDTGKDLCSQPTHLAQGERADAQGADIWCSSYRKPPKAVMLDIDDTVDIVHGHQRLAVWNAHYDERCFLPIHVYDTATGRPVVVILRPGKTPSGEEVRNLLRRLIGRIRRHWPDTRITIRGDGHYARPEVMAW